MVIDELNLHKIFKFELEFQHDSRGITNQIIQDILSGKAPWGNPFNDRFSKLIMKSGELNAFTFNNPAYYINTFLDEWIKAFSSGSITACKAVDIYAGPDIIREMKDEVGLDFNRIVDNIITPVLRGDMRANIRLFRTSIRYLIHGYLLGKYLFIFGLHECTNSKDPYINHIYNLEKPENANLYEYFTGSLTNTGFSDLYPVVEIRTERELSLFGMDRLTEALLDERNRAFHNPEMIKKHFEQNRLDTEIIPSLFCGL